jgi:DNA mismatch endonuclease Vsr
MADTLLPHERSARMSRIRWRDTAPEILVRRVVYGLGYRYRLHRRDLPGCPDLTFGKRRKVIFVHGCEGSSRSLMFMKSLLQALIPESKKSAPRRGRHARGRALLADDGDRFAHRSRVDARRALIEST